MKTNKKQLLMPGMLVTISLPADSGAGDFRRMGVIERIHDDRAFVFIYTPGAHGFGVPRWVERIQISA